MECMFGRDENEGIKVARRLEAELENVNNFKQLGGNCRGEYNTTHTIKCISTFIHVNNYYTLNV